jgi:hypothetical protein
LLLPIVTQYVDWHWRDGGINSEIVSKQMRKRTMLKQSERPVAKAAWTSVLVAVAVETYVVV